MARISKEDALAQRAADLAAGVRRTQRQYAEAWGCSVSTANAWVRAAEHEPNRSRTRPEPSEHVRRENPPNECRTCAEQAEHVREILATVRVLAKNYSKLFQELSPLLASLGEGAPAEHAAEHPNTEQAERQPNTEHRTRGEQPHLIPPEPDARLRAPRPDSPLLNLLSGKIPDRLDGTSYASPHAWLVDQWPVIASEVEAEAKGETLPDQEFNARAKAKMLRFWNHKTPRTAARARSASRDRTPPARGVFDWAAEAERTAGAGS